MDRVLEDVPGVFDLEVDVDAGRVSLGLDPDRTSASAIRSQLILAGWGVPTAGLETWMPKSP